MVSFLFFQGKNIEFFISGENFGLFENSGYIHSVNEEKTSGEIFLREPDYAGAAAFVKAFGSFQLVMDKLSYLDLCLSDKKTQKCANPGSEAMGMNRIYCEAD